MEITKEALEKKILPSLFYDRFGRRILENIEETLTNKGTTKTKILRKFSKLSDYKDEYFWKEFAEIFNEAFGSDVKISTKDDESFNNMIQLFQQIKFDHIFIEDDAERITDKKKLLEYLKNKIESKEGVINLSDKDIYRLVIPVKKEYSANISFYEPTDLIEYPSNLVKVEGDRLSINIERKASRDAFFRNIKSSISEDSEQTIIEEFVPEYLENLDVNIRSLFRNLKIKKLYITKVKFNNPSLYFNVGFKDLVDFQEFMDPDFFLNSKIDLVYFNEIRFIYSKLIDKKSHDFKIKIKIIHKECGENTSIKFMRYFTKDNLLDQKIQDEIDAIFNENGIKFNQSYELPAEYYINSIFHEEDHLQQNFDKIMKIDPENKIIKELEKKRTLTNSNGKVAIKDEEFENFKNEMLKKLSGKQIELRGSDYKLINSYIDDKGRQCLTIRVTNNESEDTSRYNVIIYPDVRTSQKITSIILKHFNYSQVIDHILNKEETSALKTICSYIGLYIKNNYEVNLLKEAESSYDFLSDYCSEPEKTEVKYGEKQTGDIVEEHLNILLKAIYRNYLIIGGRNAPDGYLTLLGKDYLLDSKQHKSIAIGEFDKVVRYLFTYSLIEGLNKTNYGIFIVCRKKIKNSLNKNARKNWQESSEFNDKYKFGFISIEYFLKIHEKLKTPKLKSSPKVIKQLFESFHNIISASTSMDSSAELEKKEDTELESINQSIKEIPYTPQRKEQV